MIVELIEKNIDDTVVISQNIFAMLCTVRRHVMDSKFKIRFKFMSYDYNPLIPILLVLMFMHLALGFYEHWMKKNNTPNLFMPISYVALSILVVIWLFNPNWHL